MNTSWNPINDDYHGNSPASLIFGGKSAMVTLTGLDMTSLLDILPAVRDFRTYAVGTLLSARAKKLVITERNTAANTWEADKAALMYSVSAQLSSTKELSLPVTFIILPDTSGYLFQKVPSYLGTRT
jgi:hypothetical protein